ncbi:TVP38/TMEM64 family protein [Aurantimonas sp. MSK8Z-1]|uniref:TVP38/TMEM64 family protein n=1 Tax=Mangrovibrevibacter kandeliae TaxID=2968473 RepID=UPI002119A143|nr:TVP38/TMEM64 family protein [Aurantimonas sp. MSK8Z-1]MCW4116433.1 TVP38/TMEM64 family protein [Aurantimonas sp. MSK8Z-1]
MAQARTNGRSWLRYAPIAGIALALAIACWAGAGSYLSLDELAERSAALQAYTREHLLLAGLGFVVVYAAAVTLVFPATLLLTLAGGLLFGWFTGGLLTILAATTGATALFLAARTAFGDVLRERVGNGLIRRFADGFRRDAFGYLLVLRLSPLFPFAAVNIAPAFFDIPLRTFVLATLIGIAPGAMIYASLGSGLAATLAAFGTSRHLELADLVSLQTTLALAGMALLSLLGLVLKKRVLDRPRRVEGRADVASDA